MPTVAQYNAMFEHLLSACSSAAVLVKLSATSATAFDGILKAPAYRDDVNAAGFDLAAAGRVLVKLSDFSALPDNRRVYISKDSGTTYTLHRINSHTRLANAIVAIDFVSANSGTSV